MWKNKHFIKEKVENIIMYMTCVNSWYLYQKISTVEFQHFIYKLDMINIYDPNWVKILKSKLYCTFSKRLLDDLIFTRGFGFTLLCIII